MNDTSNDPPAALPPADLPVARPAFDLPVTLPVTCAPIARALPARFPQLSTSRSDALIDLVLVAGLSLAFEAGLVITGVPETLRTHWPDVGILGVNALLGVFNLLLVFGALHVRRQPLAVIGLDNPLKWRTLAAAALALPACYAASMTGALVYGAISGFDTEKMLAEKGDLADLVAAIPIRYVLPFSLFVGIHEEILFRGFYLSRVRALSRSGIVAIIATSLVFGLLHFYQGPLGICQTTAIGLVLAIIVTYARSLWPAIIAHAAFDAANMLLLPWLMKTMKDLEPALTSATSPV
jgi:membrane protease YdiL (CAAX protease family)